MADKKNQDVIQAWAESAQYWEKHHATIRAMFAPVTDALLSAARIAPGQRVLDIAGGAGEPALTLAGLVGPHGHVDYCDPVKAMMDVAQRLAQHRGLKNISFQCAAAESLRWLALEEGGYCRTTGQQQWLRAPFPAAAQAVGRRRTGNFARRSPARRRV